jgi:signal transduction histidine kinase
VATKPVFFSADAGLIARLGRELVGKQETALTELIKNSYDADATHVDVVMVGNGERKSLEIRDNGAGMSSEELINGFLRLASTLKVQTPRSPRYKRDRAGSKGIGRFATERLGRTLKLTTRSRSQKSGIRLTVDWDDFQPGLELSDVSVDLKPITEEIEIGTTVRIERLRDEWDEKQLKRCLQGVMGLLQPFPVAKVLGHSHADPGFAVRFLRDDDEIKDSTIADLQTEILVHAHAVIEARVTSDGRGEWRITRNRFGEDRTWKKIHHDVGSGKSIPNYEHLRNIWMRAYYFILQGDLLPGIVFSRVRGLLSAYGGIRLYRDGFRVVPYGDSNDDWLSLDSTYARRAETLAPIANRNFFGVVEIKDSKGRQFAERTSREGLIDSPSFSELQHFLSSVLITAANTIAADRNRIGAAKHRKSKTRDQASALKVKDRIDSLLESVEKAPEKKSNAEIKRELIEIREELKDVAEDEAAFVQEVEMLRFLASIGMATSEFSHEIKMTFQTFGLDMDRIVDFARKRTQDSEIMKSAERAKMASGRIEAFTGYFNETMASRNLRHRLPVSLKKAIIDFGVGIAPIIGSQGIALETSTPPLDPLFTTPVHEAELSSILLNLLSNSVKAIKREKGERRILIEANREKSELVSMTFSDTGDGISPDLRDRIFEPFVTSQTASSGRASDQKHATGTGLGLWIVQQIVRNFGGEIDTVKPPKNFSSSFRILIPDEDARRGKK